MRDRESPPDAPRADGPATARRGSIFRTGPLSAAAVGFLDVLALPTLLASLTLTGSWGCATNPVPSRLRVSKEQAVMSGKGAPTRVTFRNRAITLGELIATTDDRVTILTEQGALASYPVSAIESVALGVHDNHAVLFGAWTALGSVSTISHGVFLVFTLPIWLVSGLSLTIQESVSGDFEYPPWPLLALQPYARFPQGAPLGLTAANLTGATPFAASPAAAPSSPPSSPPATPPPLLSPTPEPSVPRFPSLDPNAPPQ